jgi:hypothetical protein
MAKPVSNVWSRHHIHISSYLSKWNFVPTRVRNSGTESIGWDLEF